MNLDPDKIETIAVNILAAVAVAGCIWLVAGWFVSILELHSIAEGMTH